MFTIFINKKFKNYHHNHYHYKSFSFFSISNGGVAEWLRHRVSNHTSSTRLGSNPVVGTTTHKPTVN